MKVAIMYFSSQHKNTKKLLDALKETYDVSLFDVTDVKDVELSDYDIIGLASGTYFGNYSKKLLEFAKMHLPQKKKVFLINTYGALRAIQKDVKKIIADKQCELIGYFGCRGYDTYGILKYVGGIAKGHPNQKDIENVKKFLKNIINK